MVAKANVKKKTCEQCFKSKSPHEFYKAGRNKRGYFPICKDCVTILTSQNNLSEVNMILRRMDRPFIREEWDVCYYQHGDTAFGKYLTKILISKEKLGYEDSRFENEEEENKNESCFFNVDWQGYFTIQDLNYLNNYYDDLHRDYKITTRNHKDYARKIAKTSLAMDKAYQRMVNQNDTSATTEYEKLKKIFDDMCKSAKFSEATRSANDVGLGSFGVIFNKVEQHQWIPPHKPKQKDTYDLLLDQFSNIEKSI